MRTAAPMTTGTSPDVPELVFDGGLPGFPASHRYALVEWGAAGSGLFVLRSLDEEGVEFVVITPGVFFPDYAPEIDDVTAQRLGLRVADDALLLLIVTLGERPEAATANLFAPLVVHRRSRRGAQAVLAGSEHPLRQPLSA